MDEDSDGSPRFSSKNFGSTRARSETGDGFLAEQTELFRCEQEHGLDEREEADEDEEHGGLRLHFHH